MAVRAPYAESSPATLGGRLRVAGMSQFSLVPGWGLMLSCMVGFIFGAGLIFMLPEAVLPNAQAQEQDQGDGVPPSAGVGGRVTVSNGTNASASTSAGGNNSARLKQLMKEVSFSLDAWRIADGEKLLAQLMAIDDGSSFTQSVIKFFQARIAYYKGDYEKASRLVKDSRGLSSSGSGSAEELARLIVAASAQVEGFTEFRTPSSSFRLKVKPGPDLVMVPVLLAHLPGMQEKVNQVMGVVAGDSITIHIYPQIESLTMVTPLTMNDIETSGTVAVCGDNRLMVLSPRLMVRGYPWIDTITHEYVHLLATRMSKGLAPVWVQEGVARWVEGAVRHGIPPRLDVASSRLLMAAVREDKLIGFEQMHPSIANLPTQEAVALAFAQVFSFIDYVVEHSGTSSIPTVLGLLSEGVDERSAFSRVMGHSWQEVEKGWRTSLKQNGEAAKRSDDLLHSPFFPKIRFRKDGIPEQVQELDLVVEQKRDEVRVGMQLEGIGRYQAAVVMYRRAMGKVEVSSPHVASRLAFSLIQVGDSGGAERVLLKAMELYPEYGPLYKTMALADAGSGDWAQVRKWSEMALEIDPFDPSVHELLGQAYDQLDLKDLREQAEEATMLLTGSSVEDKTQGITPDDRLGEKQSNDRK